MGFFVLVWFCLLIATLISFMRRGNLRFNLAKATGALMVLLLGYGIFFNHTPPPAKPKSPPKAVKQISAAEHLTEAKKALQGYVPNKSWGKVDDAKKHLKAIPKGVPERAEAEKLLLDVAKREKEIHKASEKLAAEFMKQQRVEMAETMEKRMLSEGYDVYIKALGSQNETLKFKFILMSRPLVYQLTNDANLMGNFRNAGFKKLIFTDGYDSDWTVDLTK